MENKENKKKNLKFLKKEGLYVLLVVSLCVVAAAVALLPSKKVKNNQQAIQNGKVNSVTEKSLAQNDKKIDNAVQVKRDSNTNLKNNISVDKKQNNEVTVSRTRNCKFLKPVDGKIVMKYSQTPLWWETSKSYRPNFGINIKADVGTPVKAVAEGKVKEINKNSSFGVSVSIYHPENGKTTVYGNLDKDLNVKKGENVKAGQKIGKIGKTSLRGMSEKIGDNFLHFQVLKKVNGDPQFTSENPEKYVKY